jgi:hypothetical protein
MAINYQINTVQQAATWLSEVVSGEWSEQKVIENVLQSGWQSGNPNGIKLLASIPGWELPGVGELPRLTLDNKITNSVITDGLLMVNASVLEDIINHGRASLSKITGISNAPFITISHLRILREELEKLRNFIDSVTNEKEIIECIRSSYIPSRAVGKLAVKAAILIERETNRPASARQVMERLQKWADNGDEADILIAADIENRAVVWLTGKRKNTDFTIEACAKTLNNWYKGRG